MMTKAKVKNDKIHERTDRYTKSSDVSNCTEQPFGDRPLNKQRNSGELGSIKKTSK